VDNVTGSSAIICVNDPYTLQISGAPVFANVAVIVNGSWSSPEGQTDINGNFYLNGVTPNSPGTTQRQVWSIQAAGLPISTASPNPLVFQIQNRSTTTPTINGPNGANSAAFWYLGGISPDCCNDLANKLDDAKSLCEREHGK
jgi:hypothetical protein